MSDLLAKVEEFEGEDFPQFSYLKVLPPDGNDWNYHSPSHHVRTSLLTPEVLKDLQSGKSLLSIGCGAAHLERILTNRFGIKQIELADIDAENLPKGFKSYIFDMHQDWPELGKFDYIFFTECFFLPRDIDQCLDLAFKVRKELDPSEDFSFVSSLDDSKKKALSQLLGCAPLTSHSQLTDKQLYETATLIELYITAKLLGRALSVIKPNGQVRGDGHHILNPERQEQMLNFVKKQYPNITYTIDKELLVIRKQY